MLNEKIPGRCNIITCILHGTGLKDAQRDAIAALGTILRPKRPADRDAQDLKAPEREKERSKSCGVKKHQ